MFLFIYCTGRFNRYYLSIRTTLDQLRIFIEVAERGHMTRAAEALGLKSKSAASAAITTLEACYQTKLFDRVGRGIQLTETGRIFCARHAPCSTALRWRVRYCRIAPASPPARSPSQPARRLRRTGCPAGSRPSMPRNFFEFASVS